ncbi:thymopoietin a [Antennarius striatus]|uniref:thymopoietin a n=1 Tax=Antennarius striatus TaxID=241820 RepID=UPI0035ADD861
MPEFLDDPSVLTKERLKMELLAHDVQLPGGNPTKDVFVQLYLQNLTARNQNGAAVDAFSSDEELPPAVGAGRSRSSGRKAIRKTDKAPLEELDVTSLTDQDLRDELLKHSVDVGPVVASTRKLYEKKLVKLLDERPLLPDVVLTETQVHNGGADSDLYSDKEEEVTPAPEPEPVPVVERPLRSRGKAPHTPSTQHHPVEKIAASDQTPKVVEKDVLKELFSSEISSPTGITATCRRPIKGAAGRPLVSSLWPDEDHALFFPKATKTSSSSSFYTESSAVSRVTSLPPPTPLTSSVSTFSSSSSRPLSAAPPAAQTRPPRMSLWMKLFLVALVAAFLFFMYQTMETNGINPFAAPEAEVMGGSRE